ncbi:MAG: O-antigen ligase family protein [Bacteroidales bacterium]|nr:O-antigen ligase family protein [Bacteroidales bacterium]MBN2761918.1 O-antigen ligase family protein [Bacteroidales bacterium]
MQNPAVKFRTLLKYRRAFHHYTYLIGLAALGVSLPLSKYVISVSLFLLATNWILEGNLRNKVLQIWHRKSILLLVSVMLVYLAGMLYTENVTHGMKRILSFVPLIALSIILGTNGSFSRREIKYILLAFVLAVCISSFFSIGNYYGWFQRVISDIREISVFISHLQLSLMVNLAIIILLYLIFYDHFNRSGGEIILYAILAVWLVFFVFFLRSFLGITVFIIVFPAFLIIRIFKVQSLKKRTILLFIPVFLIISAVLLIAFSIIRFYNIDHEELIGLEPYTVNGNAYYHNPDLRQIENSHFIWLNVCQEELKREWNKRSCYDYDGLDQKGQAISHTLIRYLTSKGLKKDSGGVHQLSEQDIRLIESGYANYIFNNKYGLYQRIYQIIWEIDTYYKTGEVHSHSVAQRIVFSKQAFKIIGDNLLFGVGTGDIRSSMVEQSRLDKISVQEKWEGKPHNQYLSFMASFGLAGFCWIFFAFTCALFLEKKQKHLLFKLFLAIVMISMFSIDTFDSHVGISFFSFFYTLFLYYRE